MSRLQSARRRLSLLTSSSLAVLCFSGAASVSVALIPSAANAANECASGAASGTGATPDANGGDLPDAYVCAVSPYSSGVTYVTDGDLQITVQTGSTFGSGGVKLSAGVDSDDLNDKITLFKTGTGTMTLSTGLPIAFDLDSQSGDIVVDFSAGSVFANNAATTHNIQAISHAGGDVTITTRGNVAATGNTTTQTGGTASIEARSLGGGDVNLTLGGVNTGRLYGVLAEATGAGSLTITSTGSMSAHAIQGVAGIYAKTGTGLLSISGFGSGGAGTGALIEAGGSVQFTGGASGNLHGVNLTSTAAGTTSTINVTSSLAGGLAALRAAGGGAVDLNVSGTLTGGLDFAGLSTTPTIDILSGGQWLAASSTTITSAAGVAVSNGVGGTISIGSPDATMTFSGPSDVIDNAGLLAIGRTNDNLRTFEADAVLAGVETFNHSGVISLGQSRLGNSSDPGYPNPTDGWYDDILSLPGVHFVGQDGEIYVDVNMNATGGQSSCSGALRNADGDMPAADCVAMVGGSTEGRTFITIVDVFPGDRGAYNPDGTVIIDVSGGDSAQGHFVVGPNSAGYSPLNGGMIDKGVFAFAIAYDDTTQQHKLIAVPSSASLQFPVLAGAANSLWRTSTGTWFDRQADLRGDVPEGIGGGVWLRTSAEFADRDLVQSVEAAGQAFSFDNTFVQDSYAVTGGIDLLSGSGADTGYVVGLMVGYAHADVDYDASPNKARFNGGSLGGYASFVSGGLFVDAAVNANRLTMREDVPAFDFFPTGTLASTRIVSFGAQVEAGWRFPVMEGAFVEPVAGLSYVRAKWDNLQIVPDDPARVGAEVVWDDPASLRGSLGARAGLEQDYGVVRAQYSLLGRVWNEFEGEANVVLHNLGSDAFVNDDVSGQFNELVLGASVYSGGGAVSGFLNLGGKFGDDYAAQTASAGVRVNW